MSESDVVRIENKIDDFIKSTFTRFDNLIEIQSEFQLKITNQISDVSHQLDKGEARFQGIERNQDLCIIKEHKYSNGMILVGDNQEIIREMITDYKNRQKLKDKAETAFMGKLVDNVFKLVAILIAVVFGFSKLFDFISSHVKP